MSDLKPAQDNNEEVDLGQLFNAIGRLFENFFSFLGKTVKALFSALIYALKPIVNNFKIITIIVIIFAIVGFVAEKYNTPVYESDMLVRPYFDSKYQLANNVNYFNALINEKNLAELQDIFEIDSVEAKSLIGFGIQIGPETPNDLLVQYDSYLKSIDSTLAVEVTYDQFIENRDILAANVFSITATAKKNDVFVSLEKGFRKTFENDYSKALRKKRNDTIRLRKESLKEQLLEINKLQDVYIKVIEAESKRGEVSIGPESMFPLQQSKRETKEYDLLQRELQIRTQISILDETLIKYDSYFDILAGFEEVGARTFSLRERYVLVFPAIAFLVMILAFISLKIFNYIKDYDS